MNYINFLIKSDLGIITGTFMDIIIFILILSVIIYSIYLKKFTDSYFNLKKGWNYKNSLKASIIIAARNEEESIGNLLDCLVKQEYPTQNFEIIIANDCSTDKTVEIIRRYQQEYDKLKKNLAIHEKADLFFFKGCILSYSGIIATQQGSFFSGLSLAFEGVDALDVAIELNKVHYDALMMREIYNFYKAKKLKFLFHSKEKIIKRLLKYYPKTDIIKPLAASSLIIILRNEGLFKKALKVADEVTSRYGNTRYYLRPIIKLDILAGNYKEAITKSRVLIELLKSDVKYQSFNLYKAYYQLAKASYLAEDMETFKSAVSKLEDISLSSSEFDKMGDRPEFLREMMNGEYEAESL